MFAATSLISVCEQFPVQKLIMGTNFILKLHKLCIPLATI